MSWSELVYLCREFSYFICFTCFTDHWWGRSLVVKQDTGNDVDSVLQESAVMEWPQLMMLYVLQGVVFGLVGGVQMLMIPRLSTSQHATLGLRNL